MAVDGFVSKSVLQFFRLNEKLTGSRFLRGITVPGGLKKTFRPALKEIPEFLGKFQVFESAYNRATSSSSLIDRFVTTGVIKKNYFRLTLRALLPELLGPLRIPGLTGLTEPTGTLLQSTA